MKLNLKSLHYQHFGHKLARETKIRFKEEQREKKNWGQRGWTGVLGTTLQILGRGDLWIWWLLQLHSCRPQWMEDQTARYEVTVIKKHNERHGRGDSGLRTSPQNHDHRRWGWKRGWKGRLGLENQSSKDEAPGKTPTRHLWPGLRLEKGVWEGRMCYLHF